MKKKAERGKRSLSNRGRNSNKSAQHRNKPLHIPMKFEEAVEYFVNYKPKKK